MLWDGLHTAERRHREIHTAQRVENLKYHLHYHLQIFLCAFRIVSYQLHNQSNSYMYCAINLFI